MEEIWQLLHVLAAVIAFGVLFAQPMIARAGGGDLGEGFAKVGLYLQAPALVLVLVSGIAMMYTIGLDFADPWVSIAFTVWILMAVVLFFLVRAQRSGSKAVQPLTGGMHLLLIIALWSMIWQPGYTGVVPG
jgi:hypothetical protein